MKEIILVLILLISGCAPAVVQEPKEIIYVDKTKVFGSKEKAQYQLSFFESQDNNGTFKERLIIYIPFLPYHQETNLCSELVSVRQFQGYNKNGAPLYRDPPRCPSIIKLDEIKKSYALMYRIRYFNKVVKENKMGQKSAKALDEHSYSSYALLQLDQKSIVSSNGSYWLLKQLK